MKYNEVKKENIFLLMGRFPAGRLDCHVYVVEATDPQARLLERKTRNTTVRYLVTWLHFQIIDWDSLYPMCSLLRRGFEREKEWEKRARGVSWVGGRKREISARSSFSSPVLQYIHYSRLLFTPPPPPLENPREPVQRREPHVGTQPLTKAKSNLIGCDATLFVLQKRLGLRLNVLKYFEDFILKRS